MITDAARHRLPARECADPQECKQIADLGVTMLAAGIGNIHGKYPDNWEGLSFETLDAVQKLTGDITSGAAVFQFLKTQECPPAHRQSVLFPLFQAFPTEPNSSIFSLIVALIAGASSGSAGTGASLADR